MHALVRLGKQRRLWQARAKGPVKYDDTITREPGKLDPRGRPERPVPIGRRRDGRGRTPAAQPAQERPVAPPPTGEEPPATAHKPIWEVIEEENQLIPPEVWDSLPTDLSEQHDHYIYGTPKRPVE